MIRISHIEATSLVDGPGERTVLFMQGCPIECPGCQNKHLWPAADGKIENEMDVADTLSSLARYGNVTISGGEPFSQPLALKKVVKRLRDLNINHIIVYTGFIYEDLMKNPLNREIISSLDVLVDGPFIREHDDAFLTYRGSRNQRPINIPLSLLTGHVITLDWDSLEVVISADGNLLIPVGLTPEFAELGKVENTRRCGQTR